MRSKENVGGGDQEGGKSEWVSLMETMQKKRLKVQRGNRLKFLL